MEKEYSAGAIPWSVTWNCPKCTKRHAFNHNRTAEIDEPIVNCMMSLGKPINLLNITCVRCGFQIVMQSADAESTKKAPK